MSSNNVSIVLQEVHFTMSFSFSFAGDDIEDDESHQQNASQPNAAPTATAGAAASSAFPVQGKPLLPPIHHDLDRLLANLPSKIAYSLLEVEIEGKGSIQIPRRELWDVRVQLMAEAEGEDDGGEVESGLGSHDVKTGIYEGGFKSWESSVDLVKVLAAENLPASLAEASFRIIEVSSCVQAPFLFLCMFAPQANAIMELRDLTICPLREAGMRHCPAVVGSVPVGHAIESRAAAGRSRGTNFIAPHSGRLQPHCLAACHDAQLSTRMGA